MTTSRPQLGLNMHPKWLQGGPAEAFLLPLREVGLSVLEFTLNLAAPDWSEFDELVRACLELGFRLSFHAPYKGPYNPAGFSGPRGQALAGLFAPAVSHAAAIARRQGPTPLVVHGAKGEGARESLACDTEAFLAWIEGQEPNLCPALELRVREHDIVKIGDSKADLMAFISRWRTPRGGICWDLGHDARNGSESVPPGFTERVGHVHAHDLSPDGEDHYPLLFENVSHRAHLQRLRQVGYNRAIILELNGHVVSRLAGGNKSASERILRDSLQKLAEPFHC
ncbi:MAG: TIM barrel protein [Anaerolineae bacterium]